MYKALYRKYRPDDFSNIIGQDHIIDVLKNQIKENKISHAYLFHGDRGTGKTSTAKVFARAVNCLDYDEKKGPCNKCKSCINNEMDTIEIDAASNNSVDNIRDIKDEIVYMPNFGKYKVYIIDEVHMLSQSAFNALLKTLEEPPEYIIFILCTTEINKVLDTIKSRCQKFEFRKISEKEIYDRIKFILDKEEIHYEDEALKKIANRSNGGLRDAITIIDQISAYSSITLDSLSFVLGEAKEEKVEEFLLSLGKKDTVSSLQILDELEKNSIDIKKFPASLISFLREIMVEIALKDMENYKELKEIFKLEEIADLIVELSEIDYNMAKSTHAKVIFESFVVKYTNMIDTVSNSDFQKLEERIIRLEEKIKNFNFSKLNNIKHAKIEIPKEKSEDKKIETIKNKPKDEIKVEDVKKIEISEEEKKLIEDTELLKKDVIQYLMQNDDKLVAAMLVEGNIARFIDDDIYISYDEGHKFHKNRISNKEYLEKLEEVFKNISSKDVKINVIFENEINNISRKKKSEDEILKDKLEKAFNIEKDKIFIEN